MYFLKKVTSKVTEISSREKFGKEVIGYYRKREITGTAFGPYMLGPIQPITSFTTP